MKKAIAVIGIVGASAAANNVWARDGAATVTPTCALDPDALARAPTGDKLLAQQANLTTHKEQLTQNLEALSIDDVAGRKELADRVELNQIALSYVQKALAFYGERQANIAECESALNRWVLVGRIAVTQDGVADRQAALDVEAATVTASLDAAKTANEDLIKVGPSENAYVKLSLGDAHIAPELDQAPSRQANVGGVGAGSSSAQTDACEDMIDNPRANLRVGSCRSAAIMRSARSYNGGDVAFPSSVLRPRGLTANLAGSSSEGMVSITYADSFKMRRTPKNIPDDPEQRVQLPWEFGYSLGVKAKDGLIYSRDDMDESIKDNVDGKATVSAGLFFNVYEGETLKEWNVRAAQLKDAATKACLKDQAGGESKTPSTCAGQSLTEWVFAVKEDGTFLRPDLAKQAGDLYFRSKDDKPVWGAGVNFSGSRSNYDYLDPAIFIANPSSKNQSDGDWNFAATVFAYRRLNPTSSKWDVSMIGSLSYSRNFGYLEGVKPKQFCPSVTAGMPYVTTSCPTYYTAAPDRITSWTPAVEVRILTPRFGPLPSVGISPKFSREKIAGSTTDRWRIDLPALAFVDKEAGLGVGLQYSREWGGVSDIANADGSYDDLKAEDKLMIVATKTFSLTDF